MRCLYETLKVGRDAEAQTIKKSYRAQALVLHPDKNLGDPTAYERFQELQHAYEVLSDPQERAWYDTNRSRVLDSGLQRQQPSPQQPSTVSPFEDLLLQEKQAQAAFSGFDDSSKGFYTVFSALFQLLHSQEQAAAKAATEKVPLEKAPLFGTSKASESAVKEFYAYWSSFQTVKDFAWLDLHDPQSGAYRHMRRLLEAENSKARKAGKVAFVKEVRKLVEWVKSEDRRVQQAREKEEKKREGEAAARAARAEQARKERQEAAAKYEDADWIKEGEREQLEQMEAQQELAAQQAAAQVFECIVCDKMFKTARALQRHEAGSNHTRQLKMLKLQMQAEDCLAIDG